MSYKTVLMILFILFTNTMCAQILEVFHWENDSLMVNKSFLYDESSLYKLEPIEPARNKIYTEKNGHGLLYSIECLNYIEDDNPLYYDAIRIKNTKTGKTLLETQGYDGTFFAKSLGITAGISDAPYIKIDLGNNAFALVFAGLQYTCSDAAEMMIIVVCEESAKIVYDRPAHVYKYTPYPNYSVEYVVDVDWKMQKPDVMPPASVFNKLKRFKIWQESNILKYKPLN